MSLQDILPYRLPNHVGKRLIDPHVVIVGAGASIAACEIDKNGKKVPLLSQIVRLHGTGRMGIIRIEIIVAYFRCPNLFRRRR